jgi:hypothetical protein
MASFLTNAPKVDSKHPHYVEDYPMAPQSSVKDAPARLRDLRILPVKAR